MKIQKETAGHGHHLGLMVYKSPKNVAELKSCSVRWLFREVNVTVSLLTCDESAQSLLLDFGRIHEAAEISESEEIWVLS